MVAPSGPVVAERLAAGLDMLRGWGLETVVAPQVLKATRGSDTSPERTRTGPRDFQEAWCDSAVAAVMCARGGYGAQRMVDLLDWDAMRAAGPKVLIGYSDVTALHEAFAVRLGLATLYGPMAAAAAFLQDAADPGVPAHHAVRAGGRDDPRPARRPAPGTRPGAGHHPRRLPLPAGRGPRHPARPPSAAGGLLLLEDVGEEHYRLDRTLTQLLRSGWLDGVTGVALGSWQECGPYEEKVRPVLSNASAGSVFR